MKILLRISFHHTGACRQALFRSGMGEGGSNKKVSVMFYCSFVSRLWRKHELILNFIDHPETPEFSVVAEYCRIERFLSG